MLFVFKIYIGVLIAAIGICGNSYAAIFYASTNGSAIGSCIDNVVNVCTLDRAINVSATGDIVELSTGTYNYGASGINITKNITLQSVVALGAVIHSTNSTRTLALSAANNSTPIIVKNIAITHGGSTDRPVQINAVGYDGNVVLDGVFVQPGISAAIYDSSSRGTVVIRSCIIVGNATTISDNNLINSSSILTGNKIVTIDGCTITPVVTSTGFTNGILVSRIAGETRQLLASILNNTLVINIPENLGNSVATRAIRLSRVSNGIDSNGNIAVSIIDRNKVTIEAIGSFINEPTCIVTGSDDSVATGDNVVVSRNYCYINSKVARGLLLGGTSVLTSVFGANVQAYENEVIGVFYDGDQTPHGINCGNQINCTVFRNVVKGFAVGYLLSRGTGTKVFGNLAIGSYYAPYFSKGSVSSSIMNNTAIIDDTLYGPVFGGYGCLGVASQSGINNLNTVFTNNICYIKNGNGWKYAVVDVGQVASFDYNNYFSIINMVNTWSYQGNVSNNIASWNAENLISNELNIDPTFVSAIDWRLLPSSPMIRAGRSWGNECTDIRNRPCFSPYDIGAYQYGSGDSIVNRTVR